MSPNNNNNNNNKGKQHKHLMQLNDTLFLLSRLISLQNK